MRRTRLIGAMVALLVLGTATAGPADAAPIAGATDTWFVVVDRHNGLILFVNTSRERLCGREFTGIAALTTRSTTLPDGTVMFRHEGLVPIELWTFDTGVLDADGIPHGEGHDAANENGAQYRWSPDGTSVLVTPLGGTNRDERIVDAATGAVRTVAWSSTSYPAWQRLGACPVEVLGVCLVGG